MQSDCNDIQVHFTPSKFYSEPGEEVIFTNQSTNYHHCSWYLNNVLVSTSVHWSYTFLADGHYDVRLEVKDEDETCTAVYEIEHHVHSPIHFCGDLVLPDQDPSECPCMTSYDMNEAGQMEQKTYYRWVDRWGNKYCNLSVTGDCEDNIPFKNAPVPTPTPTLCDAGYFKLYFYPVVQNGVSYPTDAQQQVICQAFKDISVLLTPVNPNNTFVNFKINGIFDPNTGTLASAGSFYDAAELNLLNNAIIHGSVWKAINTNSSNPNIFHGLVNVNGAFNFYTGYAHQGITAGQFDLYGIMQHEILHALGFASLITSYSGSSFYQQNNLYSTFDEHLLNNGTNVLNHNGSGTYTFNNLGNNCNAVKFNNMSAPNSPVNASMNGSFYSPSHFDDVCTNLGATPPNAINPLYVMNPSIAPNQARRLQQEEVSALCKMGYVISGNYGSPTLTVGGGVNPNVRPHNNCSNSNTGIHLSASNDNFLTYGQFYSSNCTDPINGVIPYTGPYNINTLLNNDNNLSGNAIIVDLTNLQTNLPVAAADLLPNGFNFAPSFAGLHQFSYRLFHPASNTYSNIAIVSIYVTNCGLTNCQYPPEGCNLISNYEFERNPCNTLWSISHLYNQPNSVPCWRAVVGTVDFACTTIFSPTQINNGGYIFGWTAAPNTTEYVGQDIVLDPNKKYLASYYFRRNPSLVNLSHPGQFTLKMEYADQALFPVNSYQNWIQPATQQIIYETQPITQGDHGIWKQAVNTFVNPIPNGNIVVLGANQRNASLWFDLDHVELIEDNFTAGPDQYIGCDHSAILSAPCMDITNLQYAWYELDDMGNEIGAPIAVNTNVVVSPTVTTSYRLKRYIANLNEPNNNGYFVENANSLYAEDDVTVFVQLPSGNCEFSTSSNPNNCAIQFTSNNPNGTHLWDFGDGTTSTQVNPSHIFPNNGSYTVTHTIIEFGCECSYSEVIEVCCVITPIFNISNQLCQNINFSLPTTSTNGISGAWSPTFSSTNLGSTTYTFTPNFPCYPTTTMTITIIPCGDCNNAPGLHLSGEISGTLTPNQYRIVGDIEIHNSAVLNNCVFAIDPNRTITVHGDNPWNELLVFNSHFYGCHALWNGIDVKENGRLRITSSLVEDAKIAVNMQTITQQVNLGSRLIAGDVIFNKNLTGIKINGYPFSNPNQAFLLSNNVFTSRVIATNPTTWPSAATVNAPNPGANDFNFVNPRINPNVYPNANLLNTVNNNGVVVSNAAQTTTGMALYDVGLTNVIAFPSTYEFHSLVLGSPENSHVFDRLTRGIYAFKSNLEVRHAFFQATHNTFGNAGILTDGASSSAAVFHGRILVDGQTFPVHFYNLTAAIDVKDYTRLIVRNTRIRSSRTTSSGPYLGEAGIKYTSIWTHQLTVNANEIVNINNGVFANIGRTGSNVISNLYALDLDISNNNIRRVIPNGSAGVVFNRGVNVALTPGSANGFMVTTQTPFRIRNNKVIGVRQGVTLFGIAASNVRIESNEVTVAENPGTMINSNASFWGIWLRGVTPYNSSQVGNNSTVKDNYIVGFNSSNTQARGIMINNTTDFTIQCNNTRIIGAGLYFSGISPSRVRQNNMYMNRYGFWLDNGANIGAQGSVGFPAENTWENGGTPQTNWSAYTGLTPNSGIRLKTYVSNSTAQGQPMYVRSSVSQNPNDSWGRLEVLNIPYSNTFGTLFQTSGNLPKPCLVTYIEEPEDLDPEEMFDFNEKLQMTEQISSQLDSALLEAPWEIINEHETYEEIKRNPELRDSSYILENYYIMRESENVGKLREAEEKIAEQDYVTAAVLRDGITPENLIELAHRSVLSLTLKYEMGDFQTSDSLELVEWAESCSYIYGSAISKAQVLYNYIYRSTDIFDEVCPESVPRNALLSPQTQKEIKLSLYPNPTKERLYVVSSNEEIHEGNCTIQSLDGRVIYSGRIHFTRGLDLTTLNISSGVYIIEIEVPDVSIVVKEKFAFLR